MGVKTIWGECLDNDVGQMSYDKFKKMGLFRLGIQQVRIGGFSRAVEPAFIPLPDPETNAYFTVFKFEEMQQRVNRYKASYGEPTIVYYQTPVVNKSAMWLALEKSLGRQFKNPDEMAVAFQQHGDYEYYYNDKKTPTQALQDLAAIGKPGVNCVDVSQLVRVVLIDMGMKNVHIVRGDFNCGGHIWCTYGDNNRVFDAAGMMKYKIGQGQYMCSGTPTNINIDPEWLLKDDGIT